MKIAINGDTIECPDDWTLSKLVAEHGTRETVVAVNETFVPRSQYEARTLAEGDQVELLSPMEGG